MKLSRPFCALKASYSHRGSLTFIVLSLAGVALLAGCSPTTDTVEELPYHQTPASALDPEPDEEMLRHLLDSSTTRINVPFEKKGHTTLSLDDSIRTLLDLALSMVTADPSTRIKYVWGGKYIDRPTEWSKPPTSNDTCTERIGLDCSGFVQHLFQAVGFGREGPELNAASLSYASSWEFMTKKGYFVNYLPKPKVADLLPGDVLFFTDGSNNIVHTSIFWSQNARVGDATGPAMIHSAGRSRCDSVYAVEARGKLTGVTAAPYGPYWQAHTFSAIRFIGDSYLQFGIDGNVLFAREELAYAVFDSTTSKLLIVGEEEDFTFNTGGHIQLHIPDFKQEAGTYAVPAAHPDSTKCLFFLPSPEGQLMDSMIFQAAPPPNWWHGAAPAATGGELTVIGISPGPYIGSINATFKVNMNSYYNREMDTTYMVDTVQVTKSVTKYHVISKEVKGKLGGGIVYIMN